MNGLQVDHHRRALGIRDACVADDFLAVQAHGPQVAAAVHTHHRLGQVQAKALELADAQVDAAQHLLGAATGVVTGNAIKLFLPGFQVQLCQTTTHPQALARWQLGGPGAEEQFAATLVELVHGRRIDSLGDIGVSDIEPPLRPLQAHAELAVASFVGGLAERRGQVHRQALEAGIDRQLVVATAQAHLQLIRQFAGQRQGLLELQPVSQCLEGHLTFGVDPCL
ncbi:hypothetical protein D3C81_777370 [compost metagenome]